MGQIGKHPRLHALHRRIHIAANLLRRARVAEVEAVLVVMVVMIAQNQIIQPVFRLHIRQPAHVIRKIFAFKPRQNADLAAVFLRQRAHARQIFRHLTDVHAHRRMHVSVFVRPWHVIRKAQLVKSPLDRRQHIFLVRAFRMPAARRVRVIIRFHHDSTPILVQGTRPSTKSLIR